MKRLLIAFILVQALSGSAAFAQGLGQNSTSNLHQNGSGNTVTIDQTLNAGASNTSTVNQGLNGNNNAASSSAVAVTQIGGQSSEATSTITQNDTSQRATVSQDGTKGGKVTSTIAQSGSSNTATVTQISSYTADVQKSDIAQTGTGGTVSVSQQGPANGSAVIQDANHSRVMVSQSGDGDIAGAAGPVSVAAVGQVSSGLTVSQTGYASSTAAVNQFSDYSGISVNQSGISGGLNAATVNQWSGSENWAGISQSAAAGMTNASNASQSGTWNIVSVRQH